jgi:hypothetical protein
MMFLEKFLAGMATLKRRDHLQMPPKVSSKVVHRHKVLGSHRRINSRLVKQQELTNLLITQPVELVRCLQQLLLGSTRSPRILGDNILLPNRDHPLHMVDKHLILLDSTIRQQIPTTLATRIGVIHRQVMAITKVGEGIITTENIPESSRGLF